MGAPLAREHPDLLQGELGPEGAPIRVVGFKGVDLEQPPPPPPTSQIFITMSVLPPHIYVHPQRLEEGLRSRWLVVSQDVGCGPRTWGCLETQ